MTVLLLCGYRNCDPGETALGVNLIDQKIEELRRLGFAVVCVLSGQHADEQLRLCRRIAEVELVYDTQEEPNLATNIKAGLAGTDGSACFVLPVEVPTPPFSEWSAVREHWRRLGFHTPTWLYRAPSQLGFPLLVTRAGNKGILDAEGFRSLVDARLKYQDLASQELPL